MMIRRIKGKLHEKLLQLYEFMGSMVPLNPMTGNMKLSIMQWPESDIATNFEIHKRVSKLMNLLSGSKHSCLVERRGSKNDGGYFVYKSERSIGGIISFGVGSDISFEVALKQHKSVIHFYDNSITQTPIVVTNSVFFNETVGIKGITLKEAVSRIGVSPLFLKCDIEGSEWGLLEEADTSDIQRIEQIVIEFHNLQYLYIERVYNQYLKVLEKLNSTHISIFTNSNNFGKAFVIGGFLVPEVLEVTYLRRDLHKCQNQDIQSSFPLIQNDPKNISWATSFEQRS